MYVLELWILDIAGKTNNILSYNILKLKIDLYPKYTHNRDDDWV